MYNIYSIYSVVQKDTRRVPRVSVGWFVICCTNRLKLEPSTLDRRHGEINKYSMDIFGFPPD